MNPYPSVKIGSTVTIDGHPIYPGAVGREIKRDVYPDGINFVTLTIIIDTLEIEADQIPPGSTIVTQYH